jgi:hypothetical protein|tara:strand:- start:249 stop:410 length:162 start_codon:yes stop_codon:yes gene_type:complete
LRLIVGNLLARKEGIAMPKVGNVHYSYTKAGKAAAKKAAAAKKKKKATATKRK